MKVSVAFQGGGARVIELMAAAQALRELETSGVEVFRVSGASAGAIAAAMFATGCDIPGIIARSERLKKIVDRHFDTKKLRKRYILPRLARGRPIFDESALREVLIELFELGGVDARRPISELVTSGVELRILRSNIRYHNSSMATEDSEFQLWEALADSAAIPFAFKMPGRGSKTPEILDGGLFQNLPSDAATDNLGPDQVPLGFSFEKDPAPDLSNVSLTQYAGAIVNSMLSERIEDCSQRIKPSNLILIPNRRRTFDFSSIFEGELYKSFKDEVNQLKILVEGWRSSVERLEGPDWYSDHQDDLKEHIRLTDAEVMRFFEESGSGYHAEEIHHEIVYNSHDQQDADLCMTHVKLSGARNTGLQFLRFWFFDSKSGPLKRAQIEVTDKHGKPVPALIFPVRNNGKPRSRLLLVVLARPMTPEDEFVILKTEETFASMLDYMSEGRNYQTLGVGVGRSADRARLSMHFPKSLKPGYFKNASRTIESEKKEFDDETGLQVEAEFVTTTKERPGCFTVKAAAPMPVEGAEQRRFIKVVYYKDR